MPTKENGYSRFVKELSRELGTAAAKGFKMFCREWERLPAAEKNGWKQLAKGTTAIVPPLPQVLPPGSNNDHLETPESVPPKAVARAMKNDSKRGVNADQYSCFYADLTTKPMPQKYTYHPADDEELDVYGLSTSDYKKLKNFQSGGGYTETGIPQDPATADTGAAAGGGAIGGGGGQPNVGDIVKKAPVRGRGRGVMLGEKKLTVGGGSGGIAMSSPAMKGADRNMTKHKNTDAVGQSKWCSRGRGRSVTTAVATLSLEGGLTGSEMSSTLEGFGGSFVSPGENATLK